MPCSPNGEYGEDKWRPGRRRQNPGLKTNNPRAISPRRHKRNIFITVACHVSAPNMAKASGDVVSHFFFSPSRQAPRLLHVHLTSPSPRHSSRSLRSNNYRKFHPIIINTRESSREAGADGDPANRTATLLSSPLLRLDQARNFQDPPQDSISVSYLRLQPRRSAATVHGYRRTNLASKPHTPIRSIRSEPAHQKTNACFT